MDFGSDFVDPEKKLYGVWVNLDEEGLSQIKIKPFEKETFYQKLGEDWDVKTLEIKEISDENQRDGAWTYFTTEKWVKAFLLDWKGIAINGENIEFSVEQATRLVIGSAKFRKIVEEAVASFYKKTEEIEEEAEKN